MIYRKMKVMVWSPEGGTDFFYIVTGVLQEDALPQFL